MPRADPDQAPWVARRQAGIFTAAQALTEGMSQRQVRRRLAAGRWRRVAGRGLSLAGDEPPSTMQLAWAARLTHPGATVSHATAAALLGLRGVQQSRDAHVIVAPGRRSNRGIVTHQLRLTASETLRFATGSSAPVTITDRRRTALDLLATYDLGEALPLWAWVSTRRILDVSDLETAIERRRGWTGTENLRRLARFAATGAVSRAERLLHDLLRDAAVTGWAANVEVRDRQGLIGVVDLLFGTARLVVEVDGFTGHSSPLDLRRDAERYTRLTAAGYRVVRFTWADLTQRPHWVVSTIRDLVSKAV
ncbi:DUF559 domain-containing protein [Spongisporangium articulatum]|uniref:DUF559 domain-containing protein n=1 Tax=Spongisporangium articulatum TaxID=3362603 RepID=A0ABW8APC3_9ACTN